MFKKIQKLELYIEKICCKIVILFNMKIKTKKNSIGVYLIMLLWIVVGCVKGDLYDPNNDKDQLLPKDAYFGFEMRGDIKLSINYDAPGFQAMFKVYDEYPYDIVDGHYVMKENLEPIYSAYTDKNGMFEGVMNVPTSVSQAYLCTDRWGLPQCVTLNLSGNTAVYSATSQLATRAGTNSLSWFEDKQIPYNLNQIPGYAYRQDNLYSICKWSTGGQISIVNPEYVSQTTEFNGSSIAEISARAQSFLAPKSPVERVALLCDPCVANVNITKNGTKLDVVFLKEMALYKNTFGYYYYPTKTPPGNGEYGMSGDLKKMAKYVILPNVSSDEDNNVLKNGNTVSVKFFKADGTATDEFPAGYTVGWFVLWNGFNMQSNAIVEGRPNGASGYWGTIFSTNDEAKFRRFISLKDQKTGVVVLGVEDRIENPDDYCDMTFFVKSNEDITNPDQPEIPDVDPKPETGTELVKGTLAFEDVWPTGGDYDLNDVVLEYSREITYNSKNYATKVVETFTPVHNGATYENYFAYTTVCTGNITTLPEECVYEMETHSIRLSDCVKKIEGKSFTIVREFGEEEINKDNLKVDFNPYIIVSNNFRQGRKEVHLPKRLATELADDQLAYTENDAYYIDKNGKYPFAIDIPVWGFKVAQEKIRIDAETEYPAFKTWADSRGQNEKEWYIKK